MQDPEKLEAIEDVWEGSHDPYQVASSLLLLRPRSGLLRYIGFLGKAIRMGLVELSREESFKLSNDLMKEHLMITLEHFVCSNWFHENTEWNDNLIDVVINGYFDVKRMFLHLKEMDKAYPGFWSFISPLIHGFVGQVLSTPFQELPSLID